jgi:hypothetical protein
MGRYDRPVRDQRHTARALKVSSPPPPRPSARADRGPVWGQAVWKRSEISVLPDSAWGEVTLES